MSKFDVKLTGARLYLLNSAILTIALKDKVIVFKLGN
jgi:hypothetical protein